MRMMVGLPRRRSNVTLTPSHAMNGAVTRKVNDRLEGDPGRPSLIVASRSFQRAEVVPSQFPRAISPAVMGVWHPQFFLLTITQLVSRR